MQQRCITLHCIALSIVCYSFFHDRIRSYIPTGQGEPWREQIRKHQFKGQRPVTLYQLVSNGTKLRLVLQFVKNLVQSSKHWKDKSMISSWLFLARHSPSTWPFSRVLGSLHKFSLNYPWKGPLFWLTGPIYVQLNWNVCHFDVNEYDSIYFFWVHCFVCTCLHFDTCI